MTASKQASSLRQKIRTSLPGLVEGMVGALLWGLAMAFCAAVSLWLQYRAEFANYWSILLLYFIGGVLAWPFCLFGARFCAGGGLTETRFAASFFGLAFGTIAMTAFLFSQQYRLFYAQWHQPFGTRIWAFQFLFTSASAVVQFLLSGLRLYLPVGLPVIIAASLWLTRRIR